MGDTEVATMATATIGVDMTATMTSFREDLSQEP